ncbi:MAG: ribonuclease PH [Thermomicrobiales bacterium]|nr:ribonuclease PH [Thermomicrobiales bacterium]MCO5217334.1 ribonuclease PH [Thermomicrobiales bacterium]MCO5226182.1 ribonuclease PH [Thermomicrobiales bacterium]MCO5228703.1 ribonuclease PH [Thermomicrobiales bacterium]
MTIVVPMKRSEYRALDQLRTVSIERDVNAFAEGSALIKVGNTHVLCTASVDERVPKWMMGTGKGWVTAEYSMLPRSTSERSDREAVRGKQGGRTVEIQRLIGRSLRAVVDMEALGERQIILDCDVLQADGGTRCASITGAYVALAIACDGLMKQKKIKRNPLIAHVAAVSVGVVNGVPVLDLDYKEDSGADVDANIIMTSDGAFVELQSTAEHAPFTPETLQQLIALGSKGVAELVEFQRQALFVPL